MAIAGREFSEEFTLACLPQMSRDDFRACMQMAVGNGIVREVPGPGIRYRFVRAITRASITSCIPSDRQHRIASVIARKFEHYYGSTVDSHAEELYPLFLAGDGSADLEKGIRYAHIAGTRALQRCAWDRAIRVFSRLLGEFASLLNDRQRAQAQQCLGYAYCHAGNRIAASRFYRAAFAYYRSTGEWDKIDEIIRNR